MAASGISYAASTETLKPETGIEQIKGIIMENKIKHEQRMQRRERFAPQKSTVIILVIGAIIVFVTYALTFFTDMEQETADQITTVAIDILVTALCIRFAASGLKTKTYYNRK